MQFSMIFSLAMGMLPALASALPVAQSNNALEARATATGTATWYNTYYPTYSSCGMQPHDTDYIAALAPSYMPSACGKQIQVTNTNTGTTLTVTVVDTCIACAAGVVALDLTPSAFAALNNGDTSAGTFPATWTYL